MKIAVTGAGGFLGRYVLAELVGRAEVEVTATSRRELPIDSAARIVALDIEDPPHDSYEQLGRPDCLIHLAWAGIPAYRSLSHFYPQLGHQYRFLKLLIDAGLPSLLCTGTCLEYGMHSGELVETMIPNPHTPYGHAKDALRRQLQFLQGTKPVHLTWARLFYMFGEGQPETSLYPLVMSAGKRGDPSFPMSYGEQLRDYLPVQEVARYIVLLALQAPGSGIVNVCSGKPISVRKLVENWIAEHRWNMTLDLGRYPYPDYEPLAFWGCARRLQRLVGTSGR